MRDIQLRLTAGKRRRLAHVCFTVLAAGTGWLWLGKDGAALTTIWSTIWWPRWTVSERVISLATVSDVWLSQHAVAVRDFRGEYTWVFSDELAEPSFVALRRTLLAQIEGL